MLANSGSPVPIDSWASETGRSVAQLSDLLDDTKIEINEQNAVIELFGFAVSGMPWHLKIADRQLFACCPLIGNTVATITGKNIELSPVASYPGINSPVHLGHDFISANEQSGLQVSFIDVDEQEFEAGIFNAFCRHIRFYSSATDAQAFVDEHPRRFLMDMREFNAFTVALVDTVWSETP